MVKTKKSPKTKYEVKQLLTPIDNITANYTTGVCQRRMPKAMSDWIDERLNSGQNAEVRIPTKDLSRGYARGYAMKSEDCTIVFYPDWNCQTQFKDIVNHNRLSVVKK